MKCRYQLIMNADFQLNEEHERWILSARRKYKQTEQFWRDLIYSQGGKCALTGVSMLFDVKYGTPKSGGPGCHPLYASVDHINPARSDQGFQILCYDINDLKAHLPPPLCNALTRTPEWKLFVAEWRTLADSSPNDREPFKQLIAAGAPLR